MPQPQSLEDQCQLLQGMASGQPCDFNRELCAFEFPGCLGCPLAPRKVTPLEIDPMKSEVLNGWLHGSLHRPR